MKTKTKPATAGPKSGQSKKTDGRPKVKQGTGRDMAYVSETLFDDDLKG